MLQLDCIAVLFVTNGSTRVRLTVCLAGELGVTHLRMNRLYIVNYGGLVRELRSTSIATKMEHYQERRASRMPRDNFATCPASREVRAVLRWKTEFLLELRVDGSAQQGHFERLIIESPHIFFFCRRPAPRRLER